ncbi:hypothetical protein QN277_029276 [Acacia crassicarpa]|uniref:Uncharacterized protein n=1 Tax=Acacia crassicarpa TaxID=499986 RepID=A0AAE1J7H6_9FABA|nr:hypothetical protein QN277_029276 [Acacia crassicarpa]
MLSTFPLLCLILSPSIFNGSKHCWCCIALLKTASLLRLILSNVAYQWSRLSFFLLPRPSFLQQTPESEVLNAAMLYWPLPNTLYVEGYALDHFTEGLRAHQNRVFLCSSLLVL